MPLRVHATGNRVTARGLLGKGGGEKGKVRKPKADLEWGHEQGRQTDRQESKKSKRGL